MEILTVAYAMRAAHDSRLQVAAGKAHRYLAAEVQMRHTKMPLWEAVDDAGFQCVTLLTDKYISLLRGSLYMHVTAPMSLPACDFLHYSPPTSEAACRCR